MFSFSITTTNIIQFLFFLVGEERLAKHFIPYSSGSDRGPYEFEGTYGFTHGHNIPHTHVVANGHRQPGRGIRRALLRQ